MSEFILVMCLHVETDAVKGVVEMIFVGGVVGLVMITCFLRHPTQTKRSALPMDNIAKRDKKHTK